MDLSNRQGTPGAAAIGGRPIHPMLVVFPIAFQAAGVIMGALAASETR